jgi:hypothetical protein
VDQNASQLLDWQSNSPSEYYDAIGRDPSFVYGWSDYQSGGSSTQRDQYLKRRDDSNRLLQHANTVLSAVLVNHIVSALDAFRAARNFQRNVPLGFRMAVQMDPLAGKAKLDLTRQLW